jgi:integrase/recombinase XerD
VTRPILERYQRTLYAYRKKDGKPLAFVSQSQRIQAVQGFFRWLSRQNVIASNPAADLELPRTEKRLPRVILSASEVEAVLAVPDVTEPMGLRDRAMLETLYSTGVRRLELVGLELDDIDVDRGTLFVRQGKGKKDRVIPIGERALAWIDKYLREARPVLMRDAPDSTAKGLFVSYFGEPLAPDHLSQRVKQVVEAADLGKRGACHIFRHSMATQMLENGADIRFVQEMLGHAMLNTTQIYTQVSIRKLQEIHAATHPGARLKPRTSAESETEDAEPALPFFAAEAAKDDDVSR